MKAQVIVLVVSIAMTACSLNESSSSKIQARQALPTTSSLPFEPTYTSVTERILVPHCMACHEGPNSSAGLDFSSWQSLVHNPIDLNLIVPGNPLASVLYRHIEGGMRASDAELMTPVEQRAIFNWIQAGALNN